MEPNREIKKKMGRPKGKTTYSDTTTFRHNKIHSIIVENAMIEFELDKSEILRHIIIEWNMLRYKEE